MTDIFCLLIYSFEQVLHITLSVLCCAVKNIIILFWVVTNWGRLIDLLHLYFVVNWFKLKILVFFIWPLWIHFRRWFILYYYNSCSILITILKLWRFSLSFQEYIIELIIVKQSEIQHTVIIQGVTIECLA